MAPSPPYDITQRMAKLLYSGYPLINDQIYVLSNQSQYNIGLCTGSGNSAYAKTRIDFQDLTGKYIGGNSVFWNECGGNYYAMSGGVYINVNTYITNLQAAGYSYTYPASADDCGRLCYFAATSSTYAGATCRAYLWDIGSVCTLLSGSASTVSTNSSILAAGRWMGSGFVATDSAVGYKRDLPTQTALPEVSLFGRKY